MIKEIPISVPGKPTDVTADGRTAVSWECPRCGAVNQDAGYYPGGGFSCEGCGASTRVDIPLANA